MEAKALNFSNGIERRVERQESDSLYDMKNCRIIGDRILGIDAPTNSADIGATPWLYYKDGYISQPGIPFTAFAKTRNGLLVSGASTSLNRTRIYKEDSSTYSQVLPSLQMSLSLADGSGLPADRGVSYLAIPFNKDNEAGEWQYASANVPTATPEQTVTITFDTFGGDIEYIDLYKTRIFQHTILADSVGFDFSFYSLDRIYIGDRTTVDYVDKSTFEQWLVAGEPLGEPYELYPLDEPISFASSGYSPFASALHQDGPVTVYGNVEVRSKLPSVSFVDQSASPVNDINRVIFQNFYEVGGETFYGPPIVVDNPVTTQVRFNGASGINVYLRLAGSGVTYFYKKLTVPNVYGIYTDTTREGADPNQVVSVWTLRADKVNTATLTTIASAEPTNPYITYPSSVFISEPFAPRYVATVAAEFDYSEPIVAIETGRVQEEDERSYEFYIFTSKSIYFARRQDETIETYPITNVLSVKVSNGLPILAKTEQGLVFYGTDGNLYALSGRQMRRFDYQVNPDNENVVWANVTALAYHVNLNLLYVASDTGIWLYDMARQIWSGNIDEPNAYIQNQFELQGTDAIYGLTQGSIYVTLNDVNTDTPNTHSFTTNKMISLSEKITVCKLKSSHKNQNATIEWFDTFDTSVLDIKIPPRTFLYPNIYSYEHYFKITNFLSFYNILVYYKQPLR